MRAPVSTDSFLKMLVASKLVQRDDLNKYLKRRPAWPRRAEQVASLFVKDGVLTGFQTKLLLSGNHWNLFLGPYKILEQIGRGGMGEIYLSEHTTLGRLCALKVLPGKEAKNPEFRERFFREARAIAQLDHPNIVRIYDCQEGGDLPFIALEYIDGPNLSQMVKDYGALPYSAAVGYVMQAAAGLQHAHERGIFHRDIKPHNLLRDPHGTIKLLDMGLARLFGNEAQDADEQGSVMGTADYISPEQAVDSSQADHRSDIYSLGATLYHLLSGRAPFAGRSVSQVLVAHQVHEATPLHDVNAEVPRGLSAIVAKMMAKDPDRRYASAADVIRALAPWSAHVASAAPDRRKRKPKLNGEDTQVHSSARTRTDLPKSSPGIERDGASKTDLPPAPDLLHLRLHPAVIFSILAGIGVVVLLTFVLVAGANREGPANAAQAGDTAPFQEVRIFRGHGGEVEAIIPLAAGKQMLSGARDGTVRLWDVASGKELKKWDFGRPITSLAVSKDEARLAVATEGRFVALWDLQSEKEIRRWKTTGSCVDGVGLTPGGQIVFGACGRRLIAWNIDADQPRLEIKTPAVQLWDAAVTPDGAYFVTAGADNDDVDDSLADNRDRHVIRFFNVESGALVTEMKGHRRPIRRLDINSDGTRLVSSSVGGMFFIWDTITGEVLHRVSAHNGQVGCARFVPGQNRVVSGGDDRLVKVWAEAGLQQTYRGHTDKVHFVAPSRDGKFVFSGGADRTIRQWHLPN